MFKQAFWFSVSHLDSRNLISLFCARRPRSATSELNFPIKYTSFTGQTVFQMVDCNDGVTLVSLISFLCNEVSLARKQLALVQPGMWKTLRGFTNERNKQDRSIRAKEKSLNFLSLTLLEIILIYFTFYESYFEYRIYRQTRFY